MVGKTAARHTSQEFVAFLAELVANQPRRKEIHLIADNLSLSIVLRPDVSGMRPKDGTLAARGVSDHR